jgi:uncharacterized protein (DUF111 family)
VDHGHSSEHHHNHIEADAVPYIQIRAQIEAARVSDFVKIHTLGITQRIASAKAELGEINIEQVEFPEADALEWLVTAVLACIGLEQLQVRQISFQQTDQRQGPNQQLSYVALSRAILSQALIDGQIEASPLGAAIIAEFGAVLTTPPEIKSVKTGHGLGPETDPQKASFLRATLGQVE